MENNFVKSVCENKGSHAIVAGVGVAIGVGSTLLCQKLFGKKKSNKTEAKKPEEPAKKDETNKKPED